MKKEKKNYGFSLVELIIVIAIMAILAGAVAPAIIRYIDKTRKHNVFIEARDIYQEANNAIVELSTDTTNSDGDILDISDAMTFTDPQHGRVGAITNVTIYGVLDVPTNEGADLASQVNIRLAKSLTESIEFRKGKLANTQPYGKTLSSLSSGSVYLLIAYNENGVRYVELFKKGYFAHYEPGANADSTVKFSDDPNKAFSSLQ